MQLNLDTLTTPNFAVLGAMTGAQLDAAERVYQLEAIEASHKNRIGKGIGARQWLSAIRSERSRRDRAATGVHTCGRRHEMGDQCYGDIACDD